MVDICKFVRAERLVGRQPVLFHPQDQLCRDRRRRPGAGRLLAVLVAVLAALGVLNSVLMATRERVHDLGVCKAVGMTPRQTLAMVTCSVITPAVLAAAIAPPG